MIVLAIGDWLFRSLTPTLPLFTIQESIPEQLCLRASIIGAGTGRLIGLGAEEFRKVYATTAIRRLGAWICALGLVIGLMGCQSQVNKTPPSPPPPPVAAPLPRPVRTSLYVSIKQLSLRTCPRLDCPKISTLELNTEVEKMGEVEKWTQIKVKKNGAIGYVSSRYLSPHPVEVAQVTRKKHQKAKVRKAARSPEVARKEVEAGASRQEQEPSPPLSEPEGPKLPRVM